MKRYILQALIYLLPPGMEMHPNKLKAMILKIEPDIDKRAFTRKELRKILNQFRTDIANELIDFEGDL